MAPFCLTTERGFSFGKSLHYNQDYHDFTVSTSEESWLTPRFSLPPSEVNGFTMAFSFTNKEIAELLRGIAAVYQIKNMNQFQIRAYETAADVVENSSSDIKSLWEEERLDEVPGLGESLRAHLDELFRTGKVGHFEEVTHGINKSMFQLLKVPGVGPKTAYKLTEVGVESITDLEEKIKSGFLAKKDFREKTLDKILEGVEDYKRKSDRILLPVAQTVAREVMAYLAKHPKVKRADTLGSLRRMMPTVGDIDISAASNDPDSVIKHFSKTPGIDRVVEAGERTATIALKTGVRVDLMVQPLETYGNLLQHLTGSKSHNIKLRRLAQEKGYSVSEYGIKETKTNKVHKFQTEEEVYRLLGMSFPPPELREDTGEIEAALEHKLPQLIQLNDICGDLHTHSTWSDGRSTIGEMVEAAVNLGREYIALTDHSYPRLLDYDKRLKQIEQINYSQSKIRVIKGLEVNINVDATLQIPDEILAKHDFVLVAIHTSFKQPSEVMTKRILKALGNPHVDAFAHPTGRMLLEREGIEADWEKIFKFASVNNKIMEINAFPNRSDLPDLLIREAKRFKISFAIDTDSHHTSHLELMEYGIAGARRGWVEKDEVINTLSYRKLKGIIGLH
nr:DNA polymerase/3'-5' exonuclease PolX [uncultured archaeon]